MASKDEGNREVSALLFIVFLLVYQRLFAKVIKRKIRFIIDLLKKRHYVFKDLFLNSKYPSEMVV